MKKYLAYYENEWPVNIAELTAVENKPFVGYLKGEGVQFTVIPAPVVGPDDNEIWYTTVDNTPIWSNGHSMNLFMVGEENSIVNNSYNLCGILTCKNSIKVFNGHENAYASYFSTYLLNDTEGFEEGIPEGWFESSEVTSIILPEGVERINFGAFAQMNNLESITIPKSVAWIGEEVFKDSPMLKTINYNGSKEDWYKIDFPYGHDLTHNTMIHCTDGDVTI